MKKLSVILFITSFLGSISFASDFVDNKNIHEVAPGVHVGQCTAGSGEVVYLAHELVDSSNKKQWQRYADHVDFMAKKERGLMLSLAISCRPGDRPPFDQIQSVTGFDSEEEYTAYMDTLFKKELYKPEKVAGLSGIGQGIAGFSLSDDGLTYVIYASKSPIQGKFPFQEMKEIITLKEFNVVYDNLLMSVGSRVYPNSPVYENRGIFRNPKSFIDGGFNNLSTQFHGFSAAVVGRVFKDKIYALISPTPSMQGPLIKNLKPGTLFIGYNQKAPYAEFPPILHQSPTDGKITIAKEGVNTAAEFKDKDLPPELVQYTATPGDGVTVKGKGVLENVNLIKIGSLAALY